MVARQIETARPVTQVGAALVARKVVISGRHLVSRRGMALPLKLEAAKTAISLPAAAEEVVAA